MPSLPASVLQFIGNVINPRAMQAPFGSSLTAGQFKHGELLTSRVHSEHYVAGVSGNSFVASFGQDGGVAFDVKGQTTGLAVLYNPVGSGVIVDVTRFHFTTASTATVVIGGYAVEGSVQTPTGTLTSAKVQNFPLGAGQGPAAQAYTTPTITAMTYLFGLGISNTATTSTTGQGICDMGGRLTMAPGYAINVITTIDQAANISCLDIFWSEWPM